MPFLTELSVGLFLRPRLAKTIATINNPCPTKKSTYCGSGKFLGTSGVSNALSPPPIPQKKDTSKNIRFFVSRNIPINIVDKLHIWIGINLAQGKSIE